MHNDHVSMSANVFDTDEMLFIYMSVKRMYIFMQDKKNGASRNMLDVAKGVMKRLEKTFDEMNIDYSMFD